MTDIGYGLRPEHPLEKAAANAKKAGGAKDIDFARFAEFVKEYTVEKASAESGVSEESLIALAKLYADPKTKVMSCWTMGVNQHTRGVWGQQYALQHSPIDRQDRNTGQLAVFIDRPAFGLRYGSGGGYVRTPPASRPGG